MRVWHGIATHWDLGRLKDHVDLVNGYPFDAGGFNPTTGTPLIRIRDLLIGRTETYFDGYVPPEVMVRTRDIVVGMDGDFNAVTWHGMPAALNQRLCLLRAKPSLDQRYLAYLIPVPLKAINDVTYATTVKHLSSLELLAELIPLPPLPIQRAIADYLDAETARIDALIEKKQEMIGLLKDRWFAALRRELELLGKDRVRLKYLATIQRGQSPRPIEDPKYFDEAGTHGWVRIEDATLAGMYLGQTRQKLSELGKNKSISVGPGTVLVSIAASVGKPIITAIDCCYHDGWVGLLHPNAVPEFLYYSLLLPETFGGLGQLGTQVNINSEIVGNVRVPHIPMKAQKRFVEGVGDIHRLSTTLIALLNHQIDLLSDRRQSLIANAVTGGYSVCKLRS